MAPQTDAQPAGRTRVGDLILLRHGQSQWNRENRFTGWYDADLTERGIAQACEAGQILAASRLLPDVVYTSVQTRAIRTVNLALDEAGRSWLPTRRHWRLNERHYGALTGQNKAETARRHGDDQVHRWRRGFTTRPPHMHPDHPYNPVADDRYAGLPPEVIPNSESLRDVSDRLLPYWHDAIVTDLQLGRTVLIGAHGNSLRALVKHLDGLDDTAIESLEIPTGAPLHYQLDSSFRPLTAVPLDDRILTGG